VLSNNQRLKQSKIKSVENRKFYDLTAEISEKTIVFPGDPKFNTEAVCTINKKSNYNLCHLHLGNHTGTHIDFPSHVIPGGKNSNDFSIDELIGSGLIVEVPLVEKSISKSFIEKQPIKSNDFVFFKTANSKLSKYGQFNDKYVYIEPDAATALIKKGVKIVGIDYLSVDGYEAVNLPVHRALLSNDILIVENLELNEVPIGRCEIYIMPIKIVNMDGLPSRVTAKI
jgi:arylformamidase